MKVGSCTNEAATRFNSITFFTGVVELTLSQVILNAINPMVCFDVMLSANEASNDSANFTIQLMRIENQNYNIDFRQQAIIIDINQQNTR